MKDHKQCPMKKTSIGGQAVLEGIMMRGPLNSAMSVRKPDGEIVTETWPTHKKPPQWYRKTPVIRGVFAFIDSMVGGYRCLMRSADLSGMSELEEESKFDRWLKQKLGDKATLAFGAVSLVLALALALGLFMFLPMLLVSLLDGVVPLGGWKTVLEGLLKVAVFILYIFLCTLVKDVRTTFEYHGAEHKCIFCYEAGDALTVENVRKQRRFHPRCGTSFLLIVLVLSILVSSIVTWDNMLIRVALKLLMLPVVCGLSYELIKFAGRHTNLLTRIISAPGLWLQRLTTNEPNDRQIEVAITAMERVIPEDKSLDNY